MFCGNCGRELTENQMFCPSCGSKVGNNERNYNSQQYVNQPVNTYATGNVKNYNLFSAYKEMFKNYANFNGRSRRSEYWFVVLANFIIMMVAYIIMFIPFLADVINYGEPLESSMFTMVIFCVLLMIYGLAVMVPSLAVGVRRLHDTGKSGWYMLMSLIPYIGSIILIVFMATDSQPGVNQYGPNPKGM